MANPLYWIMPLRWLNTIMWILKVEHAEKASTNQVAGGLDPLVGSIWLIVLFATEGNTGENQFGEDPKAV